MTSLFSNSLLIGTDRDVRGSYKAFSRASVHAASSTSDKNDRPSTNVSAPRRNFSVETKELAKTKSLNRALKNIADYLSLIERARGTIQSVEEKLLLLEDIINQSAGVVDSNDYAIQNIGAIATATISGNAAVAKTYKNIPSSSSSGMGNGASFTILADGSGNYKITNINSAGKEYEIGDTITVNGNQIGGQTTNNDATITVTSISSINEKILVDESGLEIKFANDDIDRKSLQLSANNLVSDINQIINDSQFWDEEIFGGLRAVGYSQVGYQTSEKTKIDIQSLSTTELGTITKANFLNSNFTITSNIEGTLVEEGGVSTSGTSTNLYGWTIGREQVALQPFIGGSDAESGSITTAIGGATTPTDPTPTPQNNDSPAQVSRGDDYLASGGTFSYSISDSTLILTSDDLTISGGDVVHGPYLISNNAVELNSGDKVSFNWKADVTDNAFDTYAYLLNSNTGATIKILDQYGNTDTSFASAEATVTSDGTYYFVLVAGTFDFDFVGSATGTGSITGTSTVAGITGANITGAAKSGIAVVTPSGTSVGNASYSNVGQSGTSGSGSGARFSISADGSGNYSVASVSTAGALYSVSDTLTINGSELGGTNGVNDLTLLVSGIASNTYAGLTQASTTGSGSGAIFSISIASNGSYNLDGITTLGSSYADSDTLTISGASLGGVSTANDATLTATSVGAKTYTGITQTATSASGNAASFRISIDGSGGYTVDSITSGGSNYEVGDTVTVAGASLGGTTTTNDLTFTISTIDAIAGASIHLKDLSIDRVITSDNIIGGISLSTQAAANAAATVVANAIKQIQYRDFYLAGKELSLTSSINEVTVQQAASHLLLPPAGNIEAARSIREISREEVIKEVIKQVHNASFINNSGILKLLQPS